MIRGLTILLMVAMTPQAALADPTTNPRLQATDITWLGAFAIDNEAHGVSWFGYGGTGLVFCEDPVHGKTLFMEGDSSREGGSMAQIRVPDTLGREPSWDGPPQATVLQDFWDASDGHNLGACWGNGWRMYGGLPFGGRMIWSGTCWYSGLQMTSDEDFDGAALCDLLTLASTR